MTFPPSFSDQIMKSPSKKGSFFEEYKKKVLRLFHVLSFLPNSMTSA